MTIVILYTDLSYLRKTFPNKEEALLFLRMEGDHVLDWYEEIP